MMALTILFGILSVHCELILYHYSHSFQCFGMESCYSLAFGTNTLGMIIGTLTFMAGKNFYNKKLPEGSIFSQVFSCISYAIRKKLFSKNKIEPEEAHERLLQTLTKSTIKKVAVLIF